MSNFGELFMSWEKFLSDERISNFGIKHKDYDYRSEFEKDYHRIVSSASFRRLQDKTQVFALDKNDFVRTRLTHSMEVSSIARSLAQSLSRKLTVKEGVDLPENFESNIIAILACAGLIHDIGNPPFGHFGEDSIRLWFKNNLSYIKYKDKPISEWLNKQMYNDLLNFEGNAQALRIVTKLHFVVHNYGMDLTKALLSTIIKYPISSDCIGVKDLNFSNKFGYFYSENDVYKNIVYSTNTNGLRNPLTFILEAADDIAYSVADIEDGFKKKMFSLNQFIDYMLDSDDINEIKFLTENYNKCKKIAKTQNIKNVDFYILQNFLVKTQGYLIKKTVDCFMNNYDDIMNCKYNKTLFHFEDILYIIKKLKSFAFEYIFSSRSIKELEIGSNNIINYFLDNFIKAVINYDENETAMSKVDSRFISMLSENYIDVYHLYKKDKNESERLYLRILLVTDYICGMTDSFAKNLYQKLCGII